MANERLILAIGQMERALTRLETAQAQRDGDASLGVSQDGSDLAERHARLKVAAAQALTGLDALLAGKE
ncbi:hypothetical protein [Blastomonas aquatica]|uniref:Uncharacterized protein n=2 Tax=Blastomonas aquatica TaxID=1510276 RepID=A0ABQ1JE26_9SPHN|nr:hypothetical protein GCM10010833_22280 [Blastomonas aquatica]